jgi:hypothetical protein
MKKASSSRSSNHHDESGDDSGDEGTVFTGIKSEWTNFVNLLRGRLQRTVGPEGINYLFTNAGLDDPRFQVKVVPPSLDDEVSIDVVQADGSVLATPVTSEMKKERRELRKAIREDNEEIHNLEIKCMKHMQQCVGKHIKKKLVSFGGDPITSWRYLLEFYGPDSQGPLDTAFSFVKLLSMKMEHREMFADFMIEFEEIKDYCTLPDGCALGLLLMDGVNNGKTSTLPTRFNQDIEYAKRNKMSYKQFKQYMVQQDSQAHEQGLAREDRSSHVMVVSKDTKGSSKIVCYNCGNDGHYARECKLDACTYCKKFECGHTRDNCPRRKVTSTQDKTSRNKDHGTSSKGELKTKPKHVKQRKEKGRKRHAHSSDESEHSEEHGNSSSAEEKSSSPEKKKSSKKSKVRTLKTRNTKYSTDEDIWDPPSVRRA